MIAAIGDIHGQKGKLNRLLDHLLGVRTDVTSLVFLGDYIDRGPDSAGVIDALLQLNTRSTTFLRGNHEQFMLDSRAGFKPQFDGDELYLLENDPTREWLPQGGTETLLSYGLDMWSAPDAEAACWPKYVPRDHWEFLEKTELQSELGDNLFVHAGVLPPGHHAWEYAPLGLDPRLWIREPFISYTGRFTQGRVIFGHTAQAGLPLVQPNKVGIDTGASSGGPLTAALFESSGDLTGFVQSFDDAVQEIPAS